MIVLSGLVGALIGGLLSGLATWFITGRQIAAQEAARRRNDLRAVVGEFWGAMDRLTVASADLAYAANDSMHSQGQGPEAQRAVGKRRQEAFMRIGEATHTGSSSLGLLRILDPELALAAQALFEEARKSPEVLKPEVHAQQKADREVALRAFETAARNALVA